MTEQGKADITNVSLEKETLEQEKTALKEESTSTEQVKEESTISISKPEQNSVSISTPTSNPIQEQTVVENPSIIHHDVPIEESVVNPSISEEEKINQNKDTLGSYGRLFVPSVNLNVSLNLADMTANDVQKIVDFRDSAAYFEFNGQNVIADHNHQGFHKIINISIGDFAYIKKTDGSIENYQMTDKFEGKNIVYDLVDLSGNSVLNGKNSLVMYTCYKMGEYDNHVMITIFQLVR